MNTLKTVLTIDKQIDNANEAIRFIITNQKKLGINQRVMSKKLQVAYSLISEIRHKKKSISAISFNDIKSRLINEFEVNHQWIDYGVKPIIKKLEGVEEEGSGYGKHHEEVMELKKIIEDREKHILWLDKLVLIQKETIIALEKQLALSKQNA